MPTYLTKPRIIVVSNQNGELIDIGVSDRSGEPDIGDGRSYGYVSALPATLGKRFLVSKQLFKIVELPTWRFK